MRIFKSRALNSILFFGVLLSYHFAFSSRDLRQNLMERRHADTYENLLQADPLVRDLEQFVLNTVRVANKGAEGRSQGIFTTEGQRLVRAIMQLDANNRATPNDSRVRLDLNLFELSDSFKRARREVVNALANFGLEIFSCSMTYGKQNINSLTLNQVTPMIHLGGKIDLRSTQSSTTAEQATQFCARKTTNKSDLYPANIMEKFNNDILVVVDLTSTLEHFATCRIKPSENSCVERSLEILSSYKLNSATGAPSGLTLIESIRNYHLAIFSPALIKAERAIANTQRIYPTCLETNTLAYVSQTRQPSENRVWGRTSCE